jgi:thiol:disulfide interchange protein
MRRSGIRIALGLFILLALGGVSLSMHTRDRVLIPFQTDFDAARKQAAANHKMMLVDFSASWCTACDYMKENIWSDRHVADALRGYVPVTVDVDAHQDLAKQYQVSELPTTMVIDPTTGAVQRGLEGSPETGQQFIDWLTAPTTRPMD